MPRALDPRDHTVPRFRVAAPLCERGQLPPAAAHHARAVLRLSSGAPIEVFDGAGASALARLVAPDGFDLTEPIRLEPLPALHIRVAQALVAQQKMDWLIEKSVELGAAELVILECERCEIKLTAERAQRRAQQWRDCIESACRQCRRNRLPAIGEPRRLDAWLGEPAPGRLRLMLDPRGEPLERARLSPGSVDLLIGPEGGLSASEAAAARSAGFVAVRIGPRVLRTETAALAAIAMLQTLIGDF